MKTRLAQSIRPAARNGRDRNTKAGTAEDKPPKQKGKEVLVLLLMLFSALAAFLSFVGYGVAATVSENFGMPHEGLFSSPFELLQLSTWAVTGAVEKLPDTFGSWSLYQNVLNESWFVPAMILCGMPSMALALRQRRRLLLRTQKLRDLIAGAFRQPSDRDGVTVWAARTVLYALASWLVFPALLLVFAAVMTWLVIVLATVPIMSIGAARSHIENYVVGPERCAPKFTREQRIAMAKVKPKPKHDGAGDAQCVAVTSGRYTRQTGRVVFASSSAVILFNPANGEVWRVPLRDAVVEVIDRL